MALNKTSLKVIKESSRLGLVTPRLVINPIHTILPHTHEKSQRTSESTNRTIDGGTHNRQDEKRMTNAIVHRQVHQLHDAVQDEADDDDQNDHMHGHHLLIVLATQQ